MKQTSIKQQSYNELENLLGDVSYRVINGKKSPVSNVATFESRSKGGSTRAKENLESGYWEEFTKKYSSENGKKNIKYAHTPEAKQKHKESTLYIVEQLSLDGTHIKFWTGTSSFDNSGFIYGTVKFHCVKNTEYKGYKWRFEKKSAKGEFRPSQWTFDTINPIALSCSTKVEFKEKYPYVVSKARELGIYDDITKHMKRPFRWAENTIINEALKYNERGLFQKGAPGAYKSAKKLGIFDKVCFHMKEPAINQFTKK